jgi:hypothetical protein
MHWAEVSLLELTISKNYKFYPLKLDLRNSGLVLLVLVSGFLVFWYQPKLGFEFLEALATKKVRSSCQMMC